MARNIFFISDTHWGHENIIYHCNRPFEDHHDMDNEMIRKWNERVQPEDLVIHLGDFAWSIQHAKRVRMQLNGTIQLIIGNHDPVIKLAQTGMFQKMMESKKGESIDASLKGVLFTHRPIIMNGQCINVHGHTHNLENTKANHVNISCEHTNYAPLTLEELQKLIKGV